MSQLKGKREYILNCRETKVECIRLNGKVLKHGGKCTVQNAHITEKMNSSKSSKNNNANTCSLFLSIRLDYFRRLCESTR